MSMFQRASDKLNEVCMCIENMKRARDGHAFKAAFSSFLSNLRTVTLALQKDGKSVVGFEEWYAARQVEMGADELLKFLKVARDIEAHTGDGPLEFGTKGSGIVIKEVPPGAAFVCDEKGPYWLLDEGTPNERRMPYRGDGTVTTIAVFKNPPRKHLGVALRSSDPVHVAELAKDYMGHLIHAAREQFQKK